MRTLKWNLSDSDQTAMVAGAWGICFITAACAGLQAWGIYCMAHYRPPQREVILCMCNPPLLGWEFPVSEPPVTPATIFLPFRQTVAFRPPGIYASDDIRYRKKKKKRRHHLAVNRMDTLTGKQAIKTLHHEKR